MIPLEKSGFRLTTSKYYTPSGEDINQKGISPHVVLEKPDLTDEEVESYRKLIEGRHISQFVHDHPLPAENDTAAFIRSLQANGIVIPEDRMRKAIKDEINRANNIYPVYDLEFDEALREAVRRLREGV